MADELWRCRDHGKHCLGIQHLEKGQEKADGHIDELREDLAQGLADKTNEIKDCRKLTAHDQERCEDQIKRDYVTKVEFEPIRKLVNGVIILMVLEVLRRIIV